MYDIDWHPEAEKELGEAAEYYDEKEPGLGDEFLDEISIAAVNILDQPHLIRNFKRDHRKVVTNRFPYQLIFETRLSGVRIIAVMHQARKPDYWQGRENT